MITISGFRVDSSMEDKKKLLFEKKGPSLSFQYDVCVHSMVFLV
jgi:hypothetical protein